LEVVRGIKKSKEYANVGKGMRRDDDDDDDVCCEVQKVE
jgi:hypothetical protein